MTIDLNLLESVDACTRWLTVLVCPAGLHVTLHCDFNVIWRVDL